MSKGKEMSSKYYLMPPAQRTSPSSSTPSISPLTPRPHTHAFEVIFLNILAIQIVSVVFDEAKTALLLIKPVQFRIYKISLPSGAKT